MGNDATKQSKEESQQPPPTPTPPEQKPFPVDCEVALPQCPLNVVLCGFCNWGKSTLCRALVGDVLKCGQRTEKIEYRHLAIGSTTIGCYDLPGWRINHSAQSAPKETYAPEGPFQAILCVLDIHEARNWELYGPSLGEHLHQLTAQCAEPPLVYAVVTKLDLVAEETSPELSMQPDETWKTWRERVQRLDLPHLLPLGPLSSGRFEDLFEAQPFHCSFAGKESLGVERIREVLATLDGLRSDFSDLKRLHWKMKTNLSQVEKRLDLLTAEYVAKLPDKMLEIWNKKRKEILDEMRTSLMDLLKPDQPLNLTLIGPSGWGKTSILNALLGRQNVLSKTLKIGWQEVVTVDSKINILDTIGIEPNVTYAEEYMGQLRDSLKVMKPHVVLIVVNSHDFRVLPEYKESIHRILKEIRDSAHLPVPVLTVVTKLDIADHDIFKMTPDQTFDQWKDHWENNDPKETFANWEDLKETINACQFDAHKIVYTAVRRHSNFGVTGNMGLMDQIQADAPLNVTIQTNIINRMKYRRRNMAVKWISAFTGIGALCSLLPGVDIFMIPVISELMVMALACLASHPERTAESYRNNFLISSVVTTVVRTAVLITCLCLDATGIGTAVSLPLGAAITASTMGITGYQAYNYFTEE